MSPSRVVLLTRSGCHLCDEAESVVAEVCGEVAAGWRVLDVDSDDELRAHWTDHVPVIFIDGQLHGYWFVDADALRKTLRSPARPMDERWLPPAPTPRRIS